MAQMLERFVSPGKGNGLRATVGIRRGQLLYSAEPLACCVSNRLTKDVCHRCFSRRETLMRCSQCKTARYCNTTCQKQAWSAHKRECKCLQSLIPRIPTDSVRLAARLIFALLSQSTGSSEELYTLEEHESHLSLMSEKRKQGLSQLASMLELYLQQEAPGLAQEVTSALPPSCQEPLSLIAKVTCNCFTICDGELQEIGVGLYPSLSLLNHECRPNCVMVFEGTNLQLRAVQDIKPKEELTISYIETLSLTEDRQRQLEEQYLFTCRCQRCNSKDTDGLMLSGEETTWRLLKDALPKLEEHKAEFNWEALLKSCSHLLSTVGVDVPDENLYKLRMTDMALDACVHLGRWEEALGYGEKTLPVYRQYFPDPHPVHGVQLVRVGKLQHYLEHIDDALDTFKQAFQIVKFTHGEGHPLTTDLLMKMEECRTELDQL
ncbi:histone-lysine N-methyltransferase SMYD3 [Solea senegalensis]|uniref:[histone H3]-lysine(4) N-trimethyltransferase n=2 Tax=Solea senegalensis TaxID=28829 RepID=A0AAV6Q2R1_SOLSE|nr:histone-lysine N-methyltransferase SMYD3 [Solea senegalensis]KAG7482414.1 histone-lysine N-methyltransferase SMYD3 [Solea senegalensis]